VFSLLLENEVINNLPISIITENATKDTSEWFMGTVLSDNSDVELIVLCVKPFNMVLYETITGNTEKHVETLADELRRTGFVPPGVFAVTGLARRFAKAFYGNVSNKAVTSLVLMRLDELAFYKKAPGLCRVLSEDDLAFTPLWEQAFCVDCSLPAFSLSENEERIRTRLGKDSHFIWEDGLPVAQAVYGRDTPNGAVINWVYTPPLYRGKGYATSVVAELSKTLLNRGKSFCCLFADAENPASRRVYQKLGYRDICEFEQIQFDTSHSMA
jgi:hypothetical protein